MNRRADRRCEKGVGMDDQQEQPAVRAPRATGSPATRRTIVGALLALPVVGAVARFAGTRRGSAADARPRSIGRSSARCALCGHSGHSMLSCPDATTPDISKVR